MYDQGTDMASVCRIIILQDQLEEALRQNEAHARADRSARVATAGPPRP
jgi:hypothetical protein